MGTFIDQTFIKVGKLLPLYYVPGNKATSTTKRIRGRWLCICDCGNLTSVVKDNLGRSTNSCGCLELENRKSIGKRAFKGSGENNPFFGKKHTEETKAKIREKTKQQMTPEFRKYISSVHLGKKSSPERIEQQRQFMLDWHKKQREINPDYRKGANSPKWKGGQGSLATQIRSTQEYKDWRSTILKRDYFTCQFCSKRGRKLEVDHIYGLSQLIYDLDLKNIDEIRVHPKIMDLNNGRVLCKSCHETTPNYKQKGIVKR